MINISDYISEKLIINKNKLSKLSKINYKYYPETKEELQKILHDKIAIDGVDADMNDINVSKITDMSELFANASLDLTSIEDIHIEDWDVSNVTNMEMMFEGCLKFNCDLSSWDVSHVENMEEMFDCCRRFNCDLSRWDVSNVKSMRAMFADCNEFTSDLSKWDVSKVTNMRYMFGGCNNFDSNLDDWDVSHVTDFDYMFSKVAIKQFPKWADWRTKL